jgi:glutamyl-tRNA synthetase
MATDGKAQYDGTCREKGLSASPDAVVRFKTPPSGTTVMEDRIKKNIGFNNADIEDFVIQRSDGTPTYNLAVVVDDALMGINTIIRGDDHVSNTPKQILLYKALGYELPIFGHVPMVLGKDRTRLSKRHGAMSVTAYRGMGFLPDAFINYIVRLGWSFGDQEVFTRQELIEKFSLENIGRSASIFDPDKLQALNAEHMKMTPTEELSRHFIPHMLDQGYKARSGPYLEKVIETLRPRSKTLVEMAEGAAFYYQDTIIYEEKAAQKFLKPAHLEVLQASLEALENVSDFSQSNLEAALTEVMQKLDLKFGKIAQPMRVALSGKTVSPGIFEMIDALGKEQVISRLQRAIAYIKARD